MTAASGLCHCDLLNDLWWAVSRTAVESQSNRSCNHPAKASLASVHLIFMRWAWKREVRSAVALTSSIHCGSKKNAPTLADYNYDPVQSILIIFSKLFVNDHKSCLVVKFYTSPHICCHYTLWNTVLYFALITLLIAKKRQLRITIASISVKEF